MRAIDFIVIRNPVRKLIFQLAVFMAIFGFSVMEGFGQDTLYTKTKGALPVKVVGITGTQIKYKAFSNPDGPMYVINKKSATKVVYQNGIVDLLKKPPVIIKPGKMNPYPWLKGSGTLSVVLTDFFFKMATIHYEQTFLDDRLGIRIPLSVGFNANGNDTIYMDNDSELLLLGTGRQAFYNKNKIFSTGIDVLIYPFKPGNVNYFVGPSFGYGQLNNWTQLVKYDPYVSYVYKKDVATYSAFMIKNGVVLRPAKHLSVSLNLAMGVYKFNFKEYNNGNASQFHTTEAISRAVEGGISVGYRF